MYYQLGSTRFEGLFGPNEFERETETYYAENELIGGKSDLQGTGLALDIITLSIRLHESFCNPELRYKELETYRINKEVLPFIGGDGTVIGNFVIQKIKQTLNHTDPLGRVTNCELSISLKEFVDPDRAVAVDAAAKRDAFALGAVTPTITFSSPVSSPSVDVFRSVRSVSDGSAQAGDAVNKADQNPAAAASYLDKAAGFVDKVSKDVATFQQKLDKYGEAVANATNIRNVVNALGDNAADLSAAIISGDVPNSLTASTVLNSSVAQLGIVALPVQKLLILR